MQQTIFFVLYFFNNFILMFFFFFSSYRELPQNNFEATICEEGIRNLPNLIDLKLNDNKLERIPIFHGLIALETLELANNEIREISLAALQLLPNLRHLDLSRNFIVEIATNSFPKDNILQKL